MKYPATDYHRGVAGLSLDQSVQGIGSVFADRGRVAGAGRSYRCSGVDFSFTDLSISRHSPENVTFFVIGHWCDTVRCQNEAKQVGRLSSPANRVDDIAGDAPNQ